MSSAAAQTDPRYRDGLNHWAGRTTRRAAPGPHKQLQRALGLKGHTRIVRYKQGDPSSPAAKAIAYVDALARSEHLNPWSQITGEIVVVKRALFDGVPTEKLEARFVELIHQEHADQAAQDKALMKAALTGDYSGVADPACTHADRLTEISALAEELTERRERCPNT